MTPQPDTRPDVKIVSDALGVLMMPDYEAFAALERLAERAAQAEAERDNLDNLYWACAIDFARLRDFNAATKAAWAALSAGEEAAVSGEGQPG